LIACVKGKVERAVINGNVSTTTPGRACNSRTQTDKGEGIDIGEDILPKINALGIRAPVIRLCTAAEENHTITPCLVT
jgi:hypothetical protein